MQDCCSKDLVRIINSELDGIGNILLTYVHISTYIATLRILYTRFLVEKKGSIEDAVSA